ncbi:hypothetical protein F383_38818 [Gossypium arboreum]|uniref:Uncharacterized protein n=1 Tax=Gossypium arboreum TaxID=29729 RepID=A0A0B0MGW5_GOSAR|nr:hypothetical protein F383_38818 [Gossypium arboreum]
MPVCHGRVT